MEHILPTCVGYANITVLSYFAPRCIPTHVWKIEIFVISLAFETLPHIWEIIAQNYHYSSNLKIIPTQMWDKIQTV